jgi:hypothetical protein
MTIAAPYLSFGDNSGPLATGNIKLSFLVAAPGRLVTAAANNSHGVPVISHLLISLILSTRKRMIFN